MAKKKKKKSKDGIPSCKPCAIPMLPHKTVTISGSGQRPRMLLVNYRCPECKSKSAIEREEYDLLAAEDAVWKNP